MAKSSLYPRLILRSLLLVALLVSAAPAPMLADMPQPSDKRAAPLPAAVAETAAESLAASSALAEVTSDQVPSPNVEATLASAPLMFVENVGQFDKGARYKVYGANGEVWLTDDALWITLAEPAPRPAAQTQIP